MDGVCTTSALAHFTQDFGGLDEVLLLSFLISVSIAVVIAPLYLMIYQALVAMLMMVKDPLAASATQSINSTKAVPPVNLPLINTPDPKFQAVMQSRYKQFNHRLMLVLTVYSLGMMLLMVLYGSSDYAPGHPPDAGWLLEKFGFVLFVILMVLPVLNQLFLPSWYRRVIGIMLLLAVLVIAISVVLDETADDFGILLDEISLLLFVAVALVGFAIQKVRNVAVQVSLAVQVMLVSSFLYILLLKLGEACLLLPVFGVLEPATMDILVLLTALLYLPFMFLVWRLLVHFVSKMVVAYDRGYYSDFQLQTVLWLLLITLFFGAMISVDQSGDNALDQRSFYALLVFVLSVVLYLVLNWRIAVWQPAQSLLYLRVFATDKYSEYLFDHIAKHWRHIGPINMIGGPDFALFNLDIKEAYYLLFKRSLIHELFIDEPAALQQRLATMSHSASADKQYMVNEFFCTDNMWQPTVTELALQADHVLLDLRGFSDERKGAEFELHLLADRGLLGHTTIVVDSHTDWNAIRAALDDVPDAVIPEQRVLEMKGAEIDPRVIEYLAR